jgi:hypothetical protein
LGFSNIVIAPQLDQFNRIEGTYPTPKGDIQFKMNKVNENITAEITLPEKIQGEFVWRDKKAVLKTGRQVIRLK